MPTIELRSACHLCLDVDAVTTIDEWDDGADPAFPFEATFSGGLEGPNYYLAFCNGCLLILQTAYTVGTVPCGCPNFCPDGRVSLPFSY